MPTDQKVTGLSPVGVTLKINLLQQCKRFFVSYPKTPALRRGVARNLRKGRT